MWSSVLDAYVDDEEEGDILKHSAAAASSTAATTRTGVTAAAAAGGDGTNGPDGATAAAEYPALSQFDSPPRKKRIDILRLQMCCPTIVGAAVDSTGGGRSDRAQRRSAHNMFAFPLPHTAEGGARRDNAHSAAHNIVTSDLGSSSSSGRPNCEVGSSNSAISSVGWRVKSEKTDGEFFSSPAPRAAAVLTCSTCIPAEAGTESDVSVDVNGGRKKPEPDGNDAAGRAEHPAAAAGAQGVGEKAVPAVGSAAAVGPDGVPVLKYEKGVFHVAEEAPVKEFRVKREQRQVQKHALAPEKGTTEALENDSQRRGKMLLRMLPKPRHQQLEELFPSLVQRLQKRAPRSGDSNIGRPGSKAVEADISTDASSGVGVGCSRPAGGGNSPDRTSCVRVSSAGGGSSRDALRGAGGEEADADAEREERGPLFSLFSAYDDDADDAPAGAAAAKEETTERKETASAGEREQPEAVRCEGRDLSTADTAKTAAKLPLLGPVFDLKDETAPSDNKGSSSASSRLDFGLPQQSVPPSGGTEEACAPGAGVCGGEVPVSEACVTDIWGDSELTAPTTGYPPAAAYSGWTGAAAEQAPSEQCQPRRVEGMSLNEMPYLPDATLLFDYWSMLGPQGELQYRELQNARVKVVSGESLRDPDWQLNYQLHATSAHAKKTKLNISTNVWSVKDKGIVQTVEPRAMQKRKHQINWLAAEAAEKELEMWEMMAKTRQNKHNTSMKYGW